MFNSVPGIRKANVLIKAITGEREGNNLKAKKGLGRGGGYLCERPCRGRAT